MYVGTVSFSYYNKLLRNTYGEKFVNNILIFSQERQDLKSPIGNKSSCMYNVYINMLDSNICFAEGFVYKFVEHTSEFQYLPTLEVLAKQRLLIACETVSSDEVIITVSKFKESQELTRSLVSDMNNVETSLILTTMKNVTEEIMLAEHQQLEDWGVQDD